MAYCQSDHFQRRTDDSGDYRERLKDAFHVCSACLCSGSGVAVHTTNLTVPYLRSNCMARVYMRRIDMKTSILLVKAKFRDMSRHSCNALLADVEPINQKTTAPDDPL